MRPIAIGISTCPNDTFAFHAILERQIDTEGLRFDFQLLDIQQLNERAAEFDVVKASFFAALGWGDSHVVLRSGAAIGFGVGPVLLARAPGDLDDWRRRSGETGGVGPRLACPGALTTATFLCRTLLDFPFQLRHVTFSEIMPLLAAGEVDLGACIHEGRFTWRQRGLCCVADLGELWEMRTGLPLPLGGLVARRALDGPLLERVQRVIRRSIEFALRHRAQTLPTMRRWAQECDDRAIEQHVALYVTERTLDVGEEGELALANMAAWAVERGLRPASRTPLAVLPPSFEGA